MPALQTLLLRSPTSLILVGCVGVAALLNAEFLTAHNLFNVLRQVGPAGILAVGMALVIIAGGIDLSIGAMAALAGVIVLSVQPVLGSAAGVVLALGAGLLTGFANCVLVIWFRVNPFIGSLGTAMVLRGASLTLSDSQTITGRDPAFATLADLPIFGFPLTALVFLVIVVIGQQILASTRLGRAIYAVGGNREASRAAGLKVDRALAVAYVSTALMAAFAGVLICSQINSGSPIIGDRIPLFAIAAALIGGVSMHGGAGSLLGVLKGVLILSILQNGMNLYGVGGHYQITAIGILLVGTMMLDELLVRRRKRWEAL
jgi:ribose transport system permease protein